MHGRTNAILHKETDKITGETLERILIQQPLPPITCLAIEGGGSACAAIAGGLEVLDETGISKGIEHESGISGGGIAALAHSLGYTGKEITHTFANMPMKKFSAESESWWFTPEPLANIRKVISAYLRINSGEAKAARDNLQAWLREMIALKMDGNGRATTRDLARKIREQKARNPEDNTYKSLYLGVVRYSPGLPTLIIFDLFNDKL